MILALAEYAYGVVAGAYHRHWDRRGGWRAPVPVISVGNITVGGNGKTPFVIALIKLLEQHFPHLRERNRIAVLSRGYGRKSKELTIAEIDSHWQDTGDEPLLIKRSCPQTLVISNANRVESAKVAANDFGAKLIILDDGFQHRRLARDVDLVLLDSMMPIDNGKMLPAGRLREHPSSLGRATALVTVGSGESAVPYAKSFNKISWRALPAKLSQTWADKPKGPCFLVTGVARPNRVKLSAESVGIQIVGERAFRDHHVFSEQELKNVSREAENAGADVILTTSKDYIRMYPWRGSLQIVVIPYSLEIMDSENFVNWLSTKVDFSLR
ncbi:tetraacyldisaccharide 4'-kinase [bacterium]|nr:tetraacyldisaccharide 4'-kinase [bacterium]